MFLSTLKLAMVINYSFQLVTRALLRNLHSTSYRLPACLQAQPDIELLSTGPHQYIDGPNKTCSTSTQDKGWVTQVR